MNCSTPFSMMRRPQVGELAMSMSGSPLMVGAIPSDDIPTVNVPLQDGRVIFCTFISDFKLQIKRNKILQITQKPLVSLSLSYIWYIHQVVSIIIKILVIIRVLLSWERENRPSKRYVTLMKT